MSFVKTQFAKECQIRMKWRIKECILRNVHEFLKSDEFASNIPGVNYYLKIYPKVGIYSDYQVKVVLCLSMGKTNTIESAFTVSVKSSNSKISVNHIYSNDSTSAEKVLCSRGDIFNPKLKYFVDGFVEIELEGTLKALGGIKRKAEKFLSLAEVLWESEESKDITIVVQEQQLKIHKWILSAKSPVFKAELNSGMKEEVEKKIEITDFSFDTVKIAVAYFYEQEITEFVNEENASELLHFADKYNVKALHDIIQAILIEKLSESNVCKLSNISITSNAKELRECCICFLVNLAKQSTIIDGIKLLKDEIASEVGRRSFFSSCEKTSY